MKWRRAIAFLLPVSWPCVVAVVGLFSVAPAASVVRSEAGLEVIATGVLRPLQVAIDHDALVVLGPGAVGDLAGEIHRVDLSGGLPVDLTRQPRTAIPFADAQMSSLGSMALEPTSGDLFLGEENGTAIYRLSRDRLSRYTTGLHRLVGGSSLSFDRLGRLVLLDYADPLLSRREDSAPPGLEELREEDYRGPLVLRLVLDPEMPLPRRLGQVAPVFPRLWGGRTGGGLLPHLIAVAAVDTGDLVFVSSTGELHRLAPDGTFTGFARLPHGFYNRISMVAGPDGSVFVSGGFHVPRIFRVSSAGAVTVLADDLADPEGIAIDARGDLYIAESSLHRIVRLRTLEHRGG